MKLAALFRHLLLALSILGIGVLILGNSGDRVFATQVVLISFATWYLSGAKEDRRRIESRSVLNHRALVSAQSACLALATLSLLFVSNSQIPIVFFLLILIYYSLMFFDIQSGSPHSLLSFGLRLIIGQFVLLESLAFLYPGFVSSADTYRDFSIARSILVSSGGLPRDFGAITWYNFSPMTSLLYSAGVILSGLPLRITELVLGFVFSALPVLMVGSVVRKLMDDAFLVKGSMIIMSLLPAYWQYATQPIPEVLALVFLMECILLCLLRNKASAYLCIGIMTVATVFTHGGIALILVAIAGLLYVGTRLRQFLYTTVIGAFVFLAYCIYASVQGGPSGLTTVVSSLQAILTPSGQLLSSTLSFSASRTYVAVLESLTANSWELVFFSFAYLGFLVLIRNEIKQNALLILLTLIGGLSFVAGFTSSILVIQTSATRYLGLLSYPLLSVPAVIGLRSLVGKSQRASRLIVICLTLLLILGGVLSVTVSPTFWQDASQYSYAGNRLRLSTSFTQFASQTYLNQYDAQYSIASNMLLNLIDVMPHIAVNTSAYYPSGFYGVGNSVKYEGEPLIYLNSNLATKQDFRITYPSTALSDNTTTYRLDIVYSNGESYAGVSTSQG